MVEQSEKFNIFGQSDEEMERTKAYNAAVLKWPLGKGDCKTLEDSIASITNEIDRLMQVKVTDGGKGTVQSRIIDGYDRRRSELKAYYQKANCVKMAAEEETQSFYDQQLKQLDAVKGLTKATSGATKYIVIGMLGLIVVVAGVVIVKKLNKKK